MLTSPAPSPLELSLYVHYPFCVHKCPYCDFASLPLGADTSRDEVYMQTLLREWQLKKELWQASGREISTVYIGGGTPSLCDVRQWEHFFAAISPYVSADAEISLEANPGTVTASKLRDLRAVGFNRISIGVQSFNDRMLKRLGRIHNSHEAKEACRLAQQAGFTNFNIDLMHGLSQQDVAGALYDLQQALALDCTHLSWYELTLEEGTYFGDHPPVLPEEKTLLAIEEQGWQLLQDVGFDHYEVSAYAREERYRCRHNLNYWRFNDYLGLGAGAHQKLTLWQEQPQPQRSLQPPQNASFTTVSPAFASSATAAATTTTTTTLAPQTTPESDALSAKASPATKSVAALLDHPHEMLAACARWLQQQCAQRTTALAATSKSDVSDVSEAWAESSAITPDNIATHPLWINFEKHSPLVVTRMANSEDLASYYGFWQNLPENCFTPMLASACAGDSFVLTATASAAPLGAIPVAQLASPPNAQSSMEQGAVSAPAAATTAPTAANFAIANSTATTGSNTYDLTVSMIAADELPFEYMLNRLRLYHGEITAADYLTHTGLSLLSQQKRLHNLQAKGLISLHRDLSFALTDTGKLMANDAICEFL